jgi:hypothetical protein
MASGTLSQPSQEPETSDNPAMMENETTVPNILNATTAVEDTTSTDDTVSGNVSTAVDESSAPADMNATIMPAVNDTLGMEDTEDTLAPELNETTAMNASVAPAWLDVLGEAIENGTLRKATEEEAAFIGRISQNDTAFDGGLLFEDNAAASNGLLNSSAESVGDLTDLPIGEGGLDVFEPLNATLLGQATFFDTPVRRRIGASQHYNV